MHNLVQYFQPEDVKLVISDFILDSKTQFLPYFLNYLTKKKKKKRKKRKKGLYSNCSVYIFFNDPIII